MSYRKDRRTTDQFKKDLLYGHGNEAYIILGYAAIIFNETSIWPKIEGNSIDPTGKFIEDDSKISHSPDFIVDGVKVEVAHSNTVCKHSFHEKRFKVERVISSNSTYIFCNGARTDRPVLYIIDPKTLESLKDKAFSKYGFKSMPAKGSGKPTGKEAYRFDVAWLNKPVDLPDHKKLALPKEYDWLVEISKQKD